MDKPAGDGICLDLLDHGPPFFRSALEFEKENRVSSSLLFEQFPNGLFVNTDRHRRFITTVEYGGDPPLATDLPHCGPPGFGALLDGDQNFITSTHGSNSLVFDVLNEQTRDRSSFVYATNSFSEQHRKG